VIINQKSIFRVGDRFWDNVTIDERGPYHKIYKASRQKVWPSIRFMQPWSSPKLYMQRNHLQGLLSRLAFMCKAQCKPENQIEMCFQSSIGLMPPKSHAYQNIQW